MDVTTLREIATVACFITFLGIVCWACAARNRAGFDEAALLPFQQDGTPPPTQLPAPAQGLTHE